MVDVQVRIVAHICGKSEAVPVATCAAPEMEKKGALPLPRGLMHFLKIERNSVSIPDKTEKQSAKLVLGLAAAEVPFNWSVESKAKYKDHEWVGGGWEPVGPGGFGFAFPLQERIPGDTLLYDAMTRESKVDAKTLTVEYLVIVQKA